MKWVGSSSGLEFKSSLTSLPNSIFSGGGTPFPPSTRQTQQHVSKWRIVNTSSFIFDNCNTSKWHTSFQGILFAQAASLFPRERGKVWCLCLYVYLFIQLFYQHFMQLLKNKQFIYIHGNRNNKKILILPIAKNFTQRKISQLDDDFFLRLCLQGFFRLVWN